MNPNSQPDSQVPQQPTPPMPAPQQPLDVAKMTQRGWIVFAISLVTTLVGLFFGVALAASAIIAAYAGRLGLQVKNKALATSALILCFLNLALFIFAVIINQ